MWRRRVLGLVFVSGLSLAPAWAGGTLYKVRTNSMDCDYCAYDVQETFEQMKGVVDFEVDPEGVFFIKTAPGTRFAREQLKKILLDAGFDFKGMSEEPL